MIAGPLLIHEDLLKVADVLSESGQWKWDCFSFVFPSEIYNAMISIPRNPLSNTKDTLSWAPNSDGLYTIKSAYRLITNSNDGNGINLNWVWKILCHPRHKFFVWLLCRQSLPTNVLLCKNNIVQYPYCVLCGQANETLGHLLKECPILCLIWQYCSTPDVFHSFDSNCFDLWLKRCTTSSFPSNFNISFGTCFIYLMWNIWLARNKKIFNHETIFPLQVANRAIKQAAEFFFIGNGTHMAVAKTINPVFISWTPPQEEWFKLNIDGACDSRSKFIAVGGVIRNCFGNWVIGFNQFVGVGHRLLAEVWALLRASRLLCLRELKKFGLNLTA